MADFTVVPDRTALINVDMQNCFVEGYPSSAPDGPATLARVNGLAEVCRAAGILVVHTSHVLRRDGSNVGVLGEINPLVLGMLTEGSESAALHPDLVIDDRDVLLEKPRHGAFQSTDLDLILHARGVDTVIISGFATSVCCETTAREAVARDFRVLFLSDGTATADMPGATAAELQKATLATLGFLFAEVLTVAELTRKIAG
ncbi:cysteine hydrolase family protein [Microlunatus parietis]|uniref:Ureidoacrylate peracid hydrolase n=1 Tax=Microlunatus parietis TaxID=682979 RepID=A0A7Y9LF02_9ACTN|nr:isochorismatase family cysteine hydrolase [Microlunatus parietis]NYE75557.1 ureidoacrylate peracid hydrolase [Microlunatus parietis]